MSFNELFYLICSKKEALTLFEYKNIAFFARKLYHDRYKTERG